MYDFVLSDDFHLPRIILIHLGLLSIYQQQHTKWFNSDTTVDGIYVDHHTVFAALETLFRLSYTRTKKPKIHVTLQTSEINEINFPIGEIQWLLKPGIDDRVE